ncbi:MAG: ATP-binding cassette subfamily B protein [Candidatus Endobugula sp.]|jgi:ATP-binding cassette subfamily B protein
MSNQAKTHAHMGAASGTKRGSPTQSRPPKKSRVSILGTLWRLISVHRMAMIKSIAYGVFSGLLQLSPAICIALIAYYLQQGEHTFAIYCSIAMIIGALGSAALFALSTLTSHAIAAEMQATVRTTIADKLSRVSLGYFQRNSRESIKRLVVDDVSDLEDGVAHLIPELTAALATPVCIIMAMCFLHPVLAFAAVLPTMAGFATFAVIIRSSGELNERFYRSKTHITETLDEVIGAIPTVRSYNRGDSALTRVYQSFGGFKALIDDWIEAMMVKNSGFYLLTSSNLFIVAPVGLFFYQEQSITFPLLLFFLLASLSFNTMISSLFGLMSRMRAQEGAINRYCALMGEDELAEPNTCVDLQVNGFDIVFNNIDFTYATPPKMSCSLSVDDYVDNYVDNSVDSNVDSNIDSNPQQTLIKGLNLSIPGKSFTAIVGPSGSGKSTLAYLLARFWDVQSGSITIGGIDIRELSVGKLCSLTTFVLQEVFIFTRSIRDNICLGKPNASQEEIIVAAKAAYAHEFIVALPKGYDTILHNGEGLSLGQKQRISIARALMKDAPILVLDEAMAYADPQSEAEVQKALNYLMKKRTVIVIAHRLSTITGANQIVYIENGTVVEQGTHEELLMLNSRYASQWRHHIKAKEFTLNSQR